MPAINENASINYNGSSKFDVERSLLKVSDIRRHCERLNIQHDVGLTCFFHSPKCLFVIIIINLYFIYISQGSV